MTGTLDSLSRPLRDLRISVTDRCNLRCPYCMRARSSARLHLHAREELLDFEEIARLCRVFAALGVSKVRLTAASRSYAAISSVSSPWSRACPDRRHRAHDQRHAARREGGALRAPGSRA